MDELYHHGILGMKWGRRRYQNKDGSLTPAGKKRYSSKSENTSDMSEEELRNRINRLRMEKDYLDLKRQVSQMNPQQISKGKKLVDSIGRDVIAPAAKEAGRRLLTDTLIKQGSKALGLNSKQVESEYDKLKKEVDILGLKKKKKQYEEYFKETENKSKESNSDDSRTKNKDSTEKSEATVSGKGKGYIPKSETKSSNVYEVDYKEKYDSYTNSGSSFINEYLKRKRLPG